MEQNTAGKLYLCATPIGNLEDITIRVLNTLKEVDLIAAEDTRHSIKLLNHYGIKTPMTSYHEFNKVEKARYLVEKLKEGVNIALITDAGTPGISDPGEELVKQCREAGVELTSLPGPVACVTALTISARETRRFCFEAFLPTDKKERKHILDELKDETRTIIIYEAPHRLIRTLIELKEVFGGDRELTICKELTKKHENAYMSSFDDALSYYEDNEPRGEYVLVIKGKTFEEIEREKQQEFDAMTVEEHLNMYISQGIAKKDAIKMVAKDRGVSKRDIYNMTLNQQD
ncbi:16S rRNA (cytidine(1402)-2'-O)-methyltransferase [Falcatimonas sp. MSJ-15]|uniref:16S rRNA (cytidine(1402)-2'-O)-methyltransferase n=1 Tax=Falcatimonas sp. MSJ-15 TaxID=2841515 RepID=UPI001C0F3D9B|nr:16S rRNA (cytidine(1402)-2'-O)-methyltransferase [Falcatimonas sp. MSJ-15]MBU5470595.1 16S rRNA (cytidine(1402)-2'-O)-methyltransferase [Falcatimonas sp. MSJ-15]